MLLQEFSAIAGIKYNHPVSCEMLIDAPLFLWTRGEVGFMCMGPELRQGLGLVSWSTVATWKFLIIFEIGARVSFGFGSHTLRLGGGCSLGALFCPPCSHVYYFLHFLRR